MPTLFTCNLSRSADYVCAKCGSTWSHAVHATGTAYDLRRAAEKQAQESLAAQMAHLHVGIRNNCPSCGGWSTIFMEKTVPNGFAKILRDGASDPRRLDQVYRVFSGSWFGELAPTLWMACLMVTFLSFMVPFNHVGDYITCTLDLLAGGFTVFYWREAKRKFLRLHELLHNSATPLSEISAEAIFTAAAKATGSTEAKHVLSYLGKERLSAAVQQRSGRSS
jgi:hypothetical protein